jgi:hypothetical protein
MVASLLNSQTTDQQPTSEIKKPVSDESFDPHATKWSDVNLFKFGALITLSSTVENAFFYP